MNFQMSERAENWIASATEIGIATFFFGIMLYLESGGI